jgi:hypothetical protein
VSEFSADCVVDVGLEAGVCAVAARPAITHTPQVATMMFLMVVAS